MNLIKGTCTEALFVALNLPEHLRTETLRNPIGNSIVYDLEQRVVLIFYPMHHGYYPDVDGVLSIDGNIMTVWDKLPGSDIPEGVIEICLTKEMFHLDDEYLINLVEQAFKVRSTNNTFSSPVKVTGRPAIPRSPLILIKFLNNLVIELEEDFEFAKKHFVPFCMMQNELDELISYLNKNTDTDLSASARQFLEKSIAYKQNA